MYNIKSGVLPTVTPVFQKNTILSHTLIFLSVCTSHSAKDFCFLFNFYVDETNRVRHSI